MLLANDHGLFYAKIRLVILFYICVTQLVLLGLKILKIDVIYDSHDKTFNISIMMNIYFVLSYDILYKL